MKKPAGFIPARRVIATAGHTISPRARLSTRTVDQLLVLEDPRRRAERARAPRGRCGRSLRRTGGQFRAGEGGVVSKPSFVHLHLHTEYSMVDSTVRIPALMELCAQERMPAVAMTDQNNVFGLVKFYRAAFAAGVKPLIGVDLRLKSASEEKATVFAQDPLFLEGLEQLERGDREAALAQMAGSPFLEDRRADMVRTFDRLDRLRPPLFRPSNRQYSLLP